MTGTLMVSVSGVRGIVGTDLTPETVARWAAAFGAWARNKGMGDGGWGKGPRRNRTVVLARDARMSGPMLSQAAAAGLRSVGCDVIDAGLIPTPTAQLAVEHHRAAGGVILTASHNPAEWNALKFVAPDGIFLSAGDAECVSALARAGDFPRADWAGAGGLRTDTAAVERHVAAILALPGLDLPRLRRRRFRVALDCVRGAGGVVMPAVLERLGCRVTAIGVETDGRFPRSPEPIPEHLGALGRLVRRTKAHVGMAVDPDVDRLALVDERGRPIGEDYTLALAVRARLGRREGGRGKGPRRRRPVVVCNLSTSLVVADAARECGADIVRTPVGEAHVARKMAELGAPIGGEGNGGVLDPRLHLGRDAPLGAALVLALLAREDRTPAELVAAAPRYVIVKARIPRGPALEPVYAALRAGFPEAAVDQQDGLRLGWPDRWLHVRPSNTEPIIRLIAEGPTRGEAERLVEEGRRLCAAS